MFLPTPEQLGAVFGLSEVAISLGLRARGGAERKDRGSLALIWVVVLLALGACAWVAKHAPGARLPWHDATYATGLAVFAFGLVLRWWSIWTLGRFFTVQVAIAGDHQLVQRGPYRVLRHPSYTGVLMEMLGFALCIGSIPALVVLLVPVLGVFAWRIHIEEAALAGAFGEAWRDYARRTWRLLPFVY